MESDGWSPSVLCNGHLDVQLPTSIPYFDDTRRSGPNRFPWAQLEQLGNVLQVTRDVRPEILHTYFMYPIFYGRLLKQLGIVRHLVENREDEGFGWGPRIYRALRFTAGIPDRIVCVSESIREIVIEREGVSPERAIVIQNGVHEPCAPVSPDDPELCALRDSLGLPPEAPVVGMVANLARPVKGGPHFIEALPLIAARVPGVHFLLVGHLDGLEALVSRAEALGVRDRLLLTGFRSDVDRLYPLMSMSVLTSLSEGLSITLLESMRHGLPVVATRVGGNPDLVRDGETGLLVPPGDPEAFADAVVSLLNDPVRRRAMGQAGQERVQREFSLPAVARQYEEVYADVLAGD